MFTPDQWDWIRAHAHDDPAALRLRHHGRPGMEPLILQVECRQRARAKLQDTLARHPQWVFPSELSVQQSTSDRLAQWHASLVPEGAKVVDLTAGLGVDAHHIGRQTGAPVTVVERDPATAQALRLNGFADVVEADCRDFLDSQPPGSYDVAFIDPARRGQDGRRLYGLQDCNPDVTAMIPQVARVARRLIVKASPMLDVSATLEALAPWAHSLTALGTTAECRELVADCLMDRPTENAAVSAVTWLPAAGRWAQYGPFTLPQERAASLRVAPAPRPGQLLLEPYPTVMKAAPWRLLSQAPGVEGALGSNSHLYVCAAPMPEAGETRRIEEVWPLSSSTVRTLSRRSLEATVAVRGVGTPGLTAEGLRRRLRVTRQGPGRILATADTSGKGLILVLSALL